MSLELYRNAFIKAFPGVNDPETLEFNSIPDWDSVGHMALVSEIEDAFSITLSTDDVIDLSSFAKGLEILRNNYNVEI